MYMEFQQCEGKGIRITPEKTAAEGKGMEASGDRQKRRLVR